MDDNSANPHRHATDEPDGTPAFAASLRPAGESLTDEPGTGGDAGDEFAEDPQEETPPFGRPILPGESRAGYDVDDASGATDAVRPQ